MKLILTSQTKLLLTVLFVSCSIFGVAIEYAQEYSNHFFHKRIHGKFDKEDVYANAKGLITFSLVWMPFVLLGKKQNAKSVV